MDILSHIPVGNLTSWGALVLIVILIIRGDLVPKTEVLRRIQYLEEDREFWRGLALSQDKTLGTMADSTRTSAAALSSLPKSKPPQLPTQVDEVGET